MSASDRDLAAQLDAASHQTDQGHEAQTAERALVHFEAARALYQGLVAAGWEDAEVQMDLAESHGDVAEALEDLERYAEALEARQAGVAVLRTLTATQPGLEEAQTGLAEALHSLGRTLQFQEQWPQARQAMEQAAAIWRQRTASAAEDLDGLMALAESLESLSAVMAAQGDLAGAQTTAEDVRSLWKSIVQAAPGDPDYRVYCALAENNLADVLERQGERTQGHAHRREALAQFEAARDIRQGLAAGHEDPEAQMELAESHADVADALEDLECPPESIQARQAGVAVLRTLAAAQPDLEEAQSLLARQLFSLGRTLSEKGDSAGASQALAQAATIWRQWMARDGEDLKVRMELARCLEPLACVMAHQGSKTEAQTLAREVRALWTSVLQVAPTDIDYLTCAQEAQSRLSHILELGDAQG